MTQTFCAYAKWILSGEHAVLQGAPALVFPLKKFELILHYTPSRSLEIQADDASLKSVLKETLHYALQTCIQTIHELTGHYVIHNTIPAGYGLGFSAALSTIVGQWLESYIPVDSLLLNGQSLYRAIEHKFHGHSSGVDIAGVSTEYGLRYQIGQVSEPLVQVWQPHLYLSFSHKSAATKSAIDHVQSLKQQQPDLAQTLHERMIRSVECCQQGLGLKNQRGFDKLAEGLRLGQSCFKEWQLDPQNECDKLLAQGAVTAKPTGSGGGGCFISLWAYKPPASFNGLALFN